MTRAKKILMIIAFIASQSAWVFADGLDSISGTSLQASVGKIIKWIAGLVAVIYGSFGYITAAQAFFGQHDEGEGWKKIKNTTIGIVICIVCWALANFMIKFVN